MKRILSIALFALLAFNGLAHATQLKATFGDKDTSDVYRISQYTGTPNSYTAGWVKYSPITGVVYPYRSYTTTGPSIEWLATNDSGSVITDFGGVTANTSAPVTAGFGSTHILPPAGDATTLGTEFTISLGSRSSATVDVYSSSDVILYSISGAGLSAGDSIKSTGQAGDSVTLRCTSANTWSVVQMKGAWTDNN